MKNYLKEYLYNYHFDPSNAMLRAIEAKIISSVEFKDLILDLGCGDGTFTSVFLPESKVIGLDKNLRTVLKARAKKFYLGLISCDAKNLAFKNDSFNCLLVNSFLEHIKEDDLESVLLEVCRVLRNNGKAVITVNGLSFGQADPLGLFFTKLKLSILNKSWRRYMDRRLALYSLKDYPYWVNLFEKTNFKVSNNSYYIPFDVEKKLFFWTELQYLGISRVNLGSLIRVASKTLSFLGINLQRKAVASVFSKILKNDYFNESKTGSCIFFELEKVADISSGHQVLMPKVEVEPLDIGQIRRIIYCDMPKVTVIIPSLDGYRGGNLNKLLGDLGKQSLLEVEINIVKGVSPQGLAINLGAANAKGEILLIMDDDSRIDNPEVIENLVRTLDENISVGMAGASILVPRDANWLQKRAGKEFPRFGMKVVDKATESDMACHGCCAIPRRIFEEVGGERENILRGLDPDLRFRMRQKGYKTVLAANTWVYHPLPATLGKFIKTFFRNGMGSAYCQKYQPGLIYDTDEELELKAFNPKVPFVLRLFRFPLRLIRALLEFKFLRFLAYCVYAVGFYYGILKYGLSGNERNEK